MALTPEERQQMELYYAKPNHGFRYPSYPGLDLTHMTLADYERLWETPFADYMQAQGMTLDKAKSDNTIRPYVEGILGLLSLNDGAGKIYDYVVDTLYDGTMGQIISRKEEVVTYLTQQDKEITSDYEESWGSKKNQFLRASHYDATTDGDDRGYFFRFWRYPVSKLLIYRNINLATPEGRQDATQILTDLFGANARTYQPEDLIDETPEHLVEQRKEIDRIKREAHMFSSAEKQRLMDQPLHEMFAFSGIHFSDPTDPVKTAQEAFANPDAHTILSEYCFATDPFDEAIFAQTITLTPNQIRLQSDSLKSALTDRADNQYLTTHPDSTFEDFLKDRRGKASPTGDIEARETARKALQKILATTTKLDDKTLQDALPQKCADLNTNASDILKTNAQRKKRKMIALISSISALSAFLLFGLYKGTQLAVEGANALGEKVAEVSHTTQEKAKELVDRVKSNHTDRVEATDTTTTSATATNQTDQATAPQPTAKPTFTLKGNRPVSGAFWKGWQDPHGRTVEPMALQLAITGEFNYLLDQMQHNTNTTFAAVSHPEKTAERIMASYTKWQISNPAGQTPVRFCIAIEGKSHAAENRENRENLIRDIVNYHLNLRDVLNNIPVPASELAAEQVKTMEALGPTMGWSVYQQLAWAQNNPDKMQSAQAAITRGANGILTAQQADKSDITAVFKATCLSIKNYRDTHPDVQSYLLLAQQTVQQITGAEKCQDLTPFRHFKESDLNQADVYLKKVAHIKPTITFLETNAPTHSARRTRRKRETTTR